MGSGYEARVYGSGLAKLEVMWYEARMSGMNGMSRTRRMSDGGGEIEVDKARKRKIFLLDLAIPGHFFLETFRAPLFI